VLTGLRRGSAGEARRTFAQVVRSTVLVGHHTQAGIDLGHGNDHLARFHSVGIAGSSIETAARVIGCARIVTLRFVIRVEHRFVPGRTRSAGTSTGRFRQARRAVATHVTVHCDGRISGLASCPRKIFTGSSNAQARGVAAEAGWDYDSESDEDYCQAHRRAPVVSLA
jgi:hypothetical protein